MTNGMGDLPDRVQGIEQRIDGLAALFSARFEQVDRRFDQVDAAILEQREYTEFAYLRLDAKMDAGFARLEQRMEAGFADVGGRFAHIDNRFARLERKVDQILDLVIRQTRKDGSDSER